MATTSNMFMYSLTIQPPAAITDAVVGKLVGRREGSSQREEDYLITASGSLINLWKWDSDANHLNLVLSHNTFSIVRALAVFRFAGSPKDYLIVTSDSGRITILQYLAEKNAWDRMQLETFGKSGARRVVPGQYLAIDPEGRACMIASLEKNKLVYNMNRSQEKENAVLISSPLEAHKSQTLVFSLVALSVGWENPTFATLEVDYTDCDHDPSGAAYENVQKKLVYYQVDLGTNHVVRSWTDTVDRTASKLIQVPGGKKGPGGVLVCGEENVTYRHSNTYTSDPQPAFFVPIPRRRGGVQDPNRKRSIVAAAQANVKEGPIFLLQTEDGDIFTVRIKTEKAPGGFFDVRGITIKYFGTAPVASRLCIFHPGYLFVASESGDHYIYGILKTGEKDNELEIWSSDFDMNENGWQPKPYNPVYFTPHELDNIALVETLDRMNPITDSKVLNLTGAEAPQIYSICGTGPRSTFRTLTHGLEVMELLGENLPMGGPSALFTTKRRKYDEYDDWVVLSFSTYSLVLAISDTITQIDDSGLITTTTTLALQQVGEDSVVQVHPKGIRQITGEGQTVDWEAPQHRTVVAASTNERQIAVALSSGEIIYFEIEIDGSLKEFQDMRRMPSTVNCLSIGEVPEGRVRCDFMAVGCDDSTVRILGLAPDSILEQKSVQALSAAPTDLSIQSMPDTSSTGKALYVHIGLHSGVYIRVILDEVTGDLSDSRTRFLGPKPVRLLRTNIQGQPAVLALSSRPWLSYLDEQSKLFTATPLEYIPLDWAANIKSQEVGQSIIAVQGGLLRIFRIESLTTNIIKKSVDLAHTPRKFARHPQMPLFCVIEADNNTPSRAVCEQLRKSNQVNGRAVTNGNTEIPEAPVVNGDTAEMDDTILDVKRFGLLKWDNYWASCIQIVDGFKQEVIYTLELDNNEVALSVACVPFDNQDGEVFLVVGTAKDMTVLPRTWSEAWIHVYRFEWDDSGACKLLLIHKTLVHGETKPDGKTIQKAEYGLPTALIGFQGRLLAGIGSSLLIYDLGMKQLLRKSQQFNAVPNQITGLQTQGSRIIASDVQESLTYVAYRGAENRLVPFCDDTIARWTTSSAMLDYHTSAGGDKFGNIWAVRCPQDVSEQADEEASGAHLIFSRPYLHSTPNRLELVLHFYPGDVPTSMQRTSLINAGKDVLFWTGLQGTVGALVPFESREDVTFFSTLEMEIRKEEPPLTGRDHLVYRGYYVPVKGVIDGDLVERFLRLPREGRERIAGELDRSVREVERKIGDMRTRAAF